MDVGVMRINLESGKQPEDQSLTGWIFVEETGEFYGIAKKHCEGDDRIRFLAGVIGSNGKRNGKGIAFYEMSNQPSKYPLLYVVPDLKKPKKGSWSEFYDFGNFKEKGKVRISIEDDLEAKRKFIDILFSKLVMEINFNAEQVMELQQCRAT